MTIDRDSIVGIIIAGGKATRMGGGEKTLLSLGDQTILSAIINRLTPQVASVAINSNAPAEKFSGTKCPIFADSNKNFEGPLAGILSSMQWAQSHRPNATHIATVAGDSPFFPKGLVAKLVETAPDEHTIVMATSDGFNHPVFALWPVDMSQNLKKWLSETGILKVMAWVKTQPHIFVDFTEPEGRDPFFNINTPEDLAIAQTLVAGTPS